MKRLLDLLRSQQPSSAALRKALAQIDIAALQAEHERLKAERAALLMEADDQTLDALEARISAAARQVERATILHDQTIAGIHEAEIREAREALSTERAAVEAEAVATAKALKTQYPKLATEMVALLDRLVAAERSVRDLNDKLHKADRSDEVLDEVETRAFPVPSHVFAPYYSLIGRTTLASKPGLCPGFNERPDTGGWVVQSPTAGPLEPQPAMVTTGAPFGGFVDLA